MLAGDGVVGGKARVCDALDDALAGRPADSLDVPRAVVHVGEGQVVIHNRLALNAPEYRHQHRTCERGVRRKERVAHAFHQAVRQAVVDAVVVPGGGAEVGVGPQRAVGPAAAVRVIRAENRRHGDGAVRHREGVDAAAAADGDLVAVRVGDGQALQFIALV